MFKENIKTLKKHVYKRREVITHWEINASLSGNNFDDPQWFCRELKCQQDVMQRAYFSNQSFDIFTACCCTKRCNNTEDQNDNIIFVIKSLDDDRIASIEMFTKRCKKYLIWACRNVRECSCLERNSYYGNIYI